MANSAQGGGAVGLLPARGKRSVSDDARGRTRNRRVGSRRTDTGSRADRRGMKCAFSSAAGVRTLAELHAERPITTVIHGGATGADTMAHF
jgi:hypothetical protein